jgi:hypothetical protein
MSSSRTRSPKNPGLHPGDKRNVIDFLKTDVQNINARLTIIEEQLQELLQNLDPDGIGSTGGSAGALDLSNFKDSSGRIDFDRFNSEVRESMYNVRQLTMALRGYVALAKEAGLLTDDQIKAYQNLMKIIRVAYQAQRAVEAANTAFKALSAGSPIGVAMGLITIGGRVAGSLAMANRVGGTGV